MLQEVACCCWNQVMLLKCENEDGVCREPLQMHPTACSCTGDTVLYTLQHSQVSFPACTDSILRKQALLSIRAPSQAYGTALAIACNAVILVVRNAVSKP